MTEIANAASALVFRQTVVPILFQVVTQVKPQRLGIFAHRLELVPPKAVTLANVAQIRPLHFQGGIGRAVIRLANRFAELAFGRKTRVKINAAANVFRGWPRPDGNESRRSRGVR